MSENPQRFTGEAVPIPRTSDEAVAAILSGIVSTVGEKVLEAKRMDQAQELTIRQAELAAKSDRARRIERFAFVLLAVCVAAFFLGKPELVKEFAGALGYIGAAAVGAVGTAIGFSRQKR